MKHWRLSVWIICLMALLTALLPVGPFGRPALALWTAAKAARSEAPERVALIIGNAEYQYASPLANPVNDAEDLAELLEDYGFEVTLKTNVTAEQMDGVLADFEKKATGAKVALFYFSGHGIQYERRSYLVPTDARLRTPFSIAREGMAVDQVVAALEGAAQMSLVFLDACRNNPMAERLRRSLMSRGRAGRTRAAALTRGLGRVENAQGETLIVYAAAPGTVSYDGEGRNSPFAEALIQAVKERENAEIESLLKQVRRQVKKKTARLARLEDKPVQRPEWLSRLESDFCFATANGRCGTASGDGQAASVAPRPAPSPLRSEAAREWAALRTSKDAKDLEAFIRQFDKTAPYYARKARKRLEKLKANRVAVGVFPKPRRPSARRPLEPEMVRIPGGSFMMGCVSGKECFPHEKPVHRVTVSGFEIGKYEVTFEEWDACVQDGGCRHRPSDGGWGRGRRPVINVSWNDTQQYIRWLNRKTGKKYRLPTEAEWEYAARGDASGRNRTRYHFGNDVSALRRYGWYSKNSGFEPHPVGERQANGFGLHDMHGNVAEWVQDWNGYYRKRHQKNPKGPKTGAYRVYRGGAWNSIARFLRSAFRLFDSPDIRYPYLGFRLARTPG